MPNLRRLLSILALLTLAACSPVMATAGEATPTAPHPTLPPAEATAVKMAENTLFFDDFSDAASGWDSWSEDDGSMVAYEEGGLHMVINRAQYDYWSLPGKRYPDVVLEVDAIKLGGADNNDYGLLCRYQDHDNFYAFLASSDGYAGILKVKDNQYTVISGPYMEYHPEIHTGEQLNRLRADCVGNTLTFYVNGVKLAVATDTALQTGEIGLIAGTYDTPGADMYFDNFAASRP